MRLLDRYIGREVASHAVLGLGVFAFVFFVPQLVRLMDLIVRHTSSSGTIGLLFLCTLSPVLIFTIPMAVLVGVLIGLGRLSSDSEIVALHASGVSLRRLLVPIGFIALLSALFTLLITFWLSPASLRTLRRLELTILASQAPFSVQPRVFDERFPHFVLYVQDAEAAATQWRGVFLASTGNTQGAAVTVARDAEVISSETGTQVDLHLGTGSTHQYDPRYPDRYNVTTFGENNLAVDISGSISSSKSAILSVSEKRVSALLADHGPDWRDARVELQNRFAFPAACIVFALLGVPIGVRPRRGGRAAGLILTLVLIGGYYFLWVAGDHWARQGKLSPWLGVWGANIVALVVGVYFFHRIETVRKPNRLFNWLESFRYKQPRNLGSGAAVAVPLSNGPVSKDPFSLAPTSTSPLPSGAPASGAAKRKDESRIVLASPTPSAFP